MKDLRDTIIKISQELGLGIPDKGTTLEKGQAQVKILLERIVRDLNVHLEEVERLKVKKTTTVIVFLDRYKKIVLEALVILSKRGLQGREDFEQKIFQAVRFCDSHKEEMEVLEFK